MIEIISVPTLQRYDTTLARQLAETLESLATFDHVAHWDELAQVETARIRSAVQRLQEDASEPEAKAERA